MSESYEIEQKFIGIADINKILFSKTELTLAPALENEIVSCFTFLQNYAQNKVVYGVNTGFGPMAQYKISKENQTDLQYNLIRSHSSGMGATMPAIYCKGILLDRIITFTKCKSAVHIDLLKLQIKLFNAEIFPVVFEHGGVGASGDLVQLAHFAQVMIGEGQCWYKSEVVDTKEVFEKENITPLTIQLREGLALINGTSGMTAISLVNVHEATRLVDMTIRAGAFINELMGTFKEYFSPELNRVKMHKGQQYVAAKIIEFTADSKMMFEKQEDLVNIESTDHRFDNKVQEYYSLRCLSQIVGPIYDTVMNTAMVIENEVNSVSDNPIIDVAKGCVFHGGNFHGDYVALENDKLKIAITKLSMLLERQLNYLLNDNLNEKLPPFLNDGTLGLNFGMQGIQYTATSTVAENQMLSNPMYIHSISSNKDNQDIVSMGFNAANTTRKVIDNAYQVLSIQLTALCEATDILKSYDYLSSSSKEIYTMVRKDVVKIENDKSISPALHILHQHLKQNHG